MSDSRPFFQALPLENTVGLRLSGELDLATVGDMRAQLAALPTNGHPVTLDLADLSFMDSTGLHMLEQYARTLNGTSPLVLDNVPRHVHRLFEITGVARSPHIELRRHAEHG
jgi:phospholipid transport system transporter-binding protein